MPRITVYDFFPVEEGQLLRLDSVDRFIYRKRAVPLWNKLAPVSKILYKPSTNTNLQNVIPQGGFKYGELACIMANSSGISKLTNTVEVN